MRLRKKFLLTMLCLLMVFTMMPVTGAYADVTATEQLTDVKTMFGDLYDFESADLGGANAQDVGYIYDYCIANNDNELINLRDREGAIEYVSNMNAYNKRTIIEEAYRTHIVKTVFADPDNMTDEEKATEKKELDAWGDAVKRLEKSAEIREDKIKEEQNKLVADEKERALKNTNPEPWAGVSVSNTYALIITNGTVVPKLKDIKMFVISYLDTSGTQRKDYIYPEAVFKNTISQANAAAETAKTTSVGAAMAAEVKAVSEVAKAFSFEDAENSQDPFTPYNQETYMFQTRKTVGSFTGVSFVTAKGHESISWTPANMKLVKVNKLYGWENVGYFCDQPYINLSSDVMMEGSSVYDNQGREINVSKGVTNYISFATTSDSKKEHALLTQIAAENKTYNTYERTKTYLMNISIKNLSNAGIEAYNTDYSTGSLSLAESLFATINYTNIEGVEKNVFYPVAANSLAYYLTEMYKTSGSTGKTEYDLDTAISFAQQGENIPFLIDIPNCLKLNYVNITYGSAENSNTNYFKKLMHMPINKDDKPSDPSASTQRAIDFIEDDDLIIAGIQMWDYEDAAKAKLTTRCNQPNINPAIEATSDGVPCTYYYKTTSTSGLVISKNQGFTFSVPKSSVSSNASYNDFIKAQTEVRRQIYDLSGNTYIYSAEKQKHQAVQLLADDTGLEGDSWYAIEITTDTPSLASTTSKAFVQIKYEAKDGTDKTTSAIDLADSANEFYGYWAGAKTNKLSTKTVSANYESIDGGYRYGVAGGNTFVALFKLPNIARASGDCFKSATFSIENTKDADDWQISSFKIYKVEALTNRVVTKIDTTNFNKMLTNRYYSRTFHVTNSAGVDTATLMVSSPNSIPIFIQALNKVTVDFTGTEEQEIAQYKDRSQILQYMESMPLEVALGEMGFTETMKTYTVQVDVASNEDYGTIYDACGSDNYFYFQLNFEKGRSSYVLANQQLTGDGFRSGQIESFAISTNMDYGDLTSIAIVADTTNENANPEDKLCINTLSVIRSTVSGVKKMWVSKYVGWVGTQIEDTGDDSNTKNEEGHSAGELEQCFMIDYDTLVVSLEIQMTIGSDQDLTANNEAYGQFEGNLMADIRYETFTGGEKYLNDVQIVKALYDYNGYGASIDTDSQMYISDTDMHFRANTTDRFNVDISDFKGLKEIYFYAASDKPAKLNIEAINVYVVTSPGTLYINSANEYQKSYKTPLAFLVSSNEPFSLVTSGSGEGGQWQVFNRQVTFDENYIENIIDTSESMNIIASTPKSINDQLSVFFPISPEGLTNDSNPVYLTLEYAQSEDTTKYKTVTTRMNINKDHNGYYCNGISVPRFTNIVNFTLKTEYYGDATKNVYINGKQAFIEHSRDGVLLDTRTATFLENSTKTNISSTEGGRTCSGGTSNGANSQISINSKGGYKEVLKIQLASTQAETVLTKETKDIGVCLSFDTTNNNSGVARTYRSGYVYASEYGTDGTGVDSMTIRGGSILTFEFDVENIASIEGITIMPTGGLSIVVDKAYLVYEKMNSNRTGVESYEGYYGFPLGGTASLGGLYMRPKNVSDQSYLGYLSNSTVREVTVTIKTGTSSSGSVGVAAADMEIKFNACGYNKDHVLTEETGDCLTATFLNIQKYITDPTATGFDAGSTRTMKFLVKDYGKIRSIRLIPRGTEGAYGVWKIEEISVSAPTYTKTIMTNGSATVIQPVSSDGSNGRIIYEAQDGYSFSCASIQITSELNYSSISETVFSSSEDIVNCSVDAGNTLVMKPRVSGSLLGSTSFYVDMKEITGGAKRGVDEKYLTVKDSTGEVIFTAPDNVAEEGKTATDRVYELTVYSQECESVEVVVHVTVPPGAKDNKEQSIVTPES